MRCHPAGAKRVSGSTIVALRRPSSACTEDPDTGSLRSPCGMTSSRTRAGTCALVSDFTVVCADLRGYGASGRPASLADHSPYAKRAMALDLVRAMEQLGHRRFHVAGHDRGARVACRMALDHPDRVERLAVLDVIPSAEALRRADARLMLSFWPWSLLAQPEPLPERLIVADPEAVIFDAVTHWGTRAESFPPEIRAVYAYALSDPSSVHAICKEYRAAATIDCHAR
ncbi:MAG: alpha/beta fold hydrolase [bacterium]